MPSDIPEDVKKLIFESIDSVELLDVLLLIHADKSRSWSADDLSRELRASAHSIDIRLSCLIKMGLAAASGGAINSFYYAPRTAELNETVGRLSAQNAIQRHRLLQLIFSPLKRARIIANGFRVSKKPGDGDPDG